MLKKLSAMDKVFSNQDLLIYMMSYIFETDTLYEDLILNCYFLKQVNKIFHYSVNYITSKIVKTGFNNVTMDTILEKENNVNILKYIAKYELENNFEDYVMKNEDIAYDYIDVSYNYPFSPSTLTSECALNVLSNVFNFSKLNVTVTYFNFKNLIKFELNEQIDDNYIPSSDFYMSLPTEISSAESPVRLLCGLKIFVNDVDLDKIFIKHVNRNCIRCNDNVYLSDKFGVEYEHQCCEEGYFCGPCWQSSHAWDNISVKCGYCDKIYHTLDDVEIIDLTND